MEGGRLLSRMPPVPTSPRSIGFGIGVIQGVWKNENDDVVLTISFHPMTMEDVVLLFVGLLPALCLLWEVLFVSLPRLWHWLGEKAKRDDEVRLLEEATTRRGSVTALGKNDSGAHLLVLAARHDDV